MTTVSTTPPSPASSGSSSTPPTKLAAAQTGLITLLTSNGMMASLDTSGTASKAPTSQQILTKLQAFFNPDDSNTITKTDVQQAVTALGGSASDATAIWSQLSPYGLNNISKASVASNTFLSATVNANMTTVQKTFSTYINSSAGIAGSTMSQLFTSNDVVQALSSESSTYVPPSTNNMISTVWALFDANGTKTISEGDVQKAVLAEGGTIGGAKAIWSQLAPGGSTSIGINQFISSQFVTTALTVNAPTVQSDISKVLLTNAGTSNSVLDKFSSSGADILNQAASGYSDSPVGGGGYTNNLNLFI